MHQVGAVGAVLVCAACGAGGEVTPEGGYEALWGAGWRWRGVHAKIPKFASSVFVFSCPDCPAVIG
ncbi:hypothetical protein ACFZAM_31665 [Streptomyces sp. NPDC008079]|uniref:hypothetical protein n=1 Tax=Streptomyces sp. NPDC008079 TaxID=3364806 RepID=UPI0036EDB69A